MSFTNDLIEQPEAQAMTQSSAASTSTSATTSSSTMASVASEATKPADGTNTNSTKPSPSPDGLSGGAIAGVAVGCLIAGILVGAIAAWFLLRRRHKQSRDSSSMREIIEPKRESPIPTQPQGSNSPSVTGRSPIIESDLAPFLLDGVAGSELVAEVESLGELIYQHVESNYHLGPIQHSVNTLGATIAALGMGQHHALGAQYLAALCVDPNTRQIGLRHIISYVLFRNIDFQQPGENPMLPLPVSIFLESLPTRIRHENQSKGIPLAMSTWRKLSAFLLHPTPSERTAVPFPESTVNYQVSPLVETLDSFLHHFAASQGQKKHLEDVAIECAKFGYKIFSHPNDWQFVYIGDDDQSSHSIMVCPGLEKLSGRDGTWYSCPNRILQPAEWRLR